MTVDRKKLREAAEAITASVWRHDPQIPTIVWFGDGGFDLRNCPQANERAAFIAALNPALVLDLLDALDAAEARVAWKPISSIAEPVAGKRILVCDGDGGDPYIVWWTKDAYSEDGGKGGPSGWYNEHSRGDSIFMHQPAFFQDLAATPCIATAIRSTS